MVTLLHYVPEPDHTRALRELWSDRAELYEHVHRAFVGAIGKPDIRERHRRSFAPAIAACNADIAEHAVPGKKPGVLE